MRAAVAIVGAGLAGAATAYFLRRRGVTDVVLLEREAAPGAHASGRNAGLIRALIDDDALAEAAREGAAWLREPPADLARGAPLARTTGSLILGATGEPGGDLARFAPPAGATRVSPADALRLAPELRGAAAAIGAAWLTPADAVIAEPRRLLDAYIAASGARLLAPCAALRLLLSGGRAAGL